MAAKHYDAVFIGNGLISLSAAALLSKAGRSVLLIDPDERLSSEPPDSALPFSDGPLLYFGYETGGGMEGYFSRLSYPIPSLQQQGFRFKRSPLTLQVVQSFHRSNLYFEKGRYLDELEREYGKQIQKLKQLFEQVEKETTSYYAYVAQFQQLEVAGMGERLNEWKRRLDITKAISNQQRQNASDYLGQFAFTPDLRKYFELLSLFAFGQPLSEISVFELMMLLVGFQKGGVQMMGGYASLVGFFRQLIQDQDGKLSCGRAVSKVERNGNFISRLHLSDGSQISAQHFILAGHSVPTRLTFYFSLPHELIPEPMKELVLLSWGEDPPSYLEDLIVLRLNHLEEEPLKTGRRLIAASVLFRSKNKSIEKVSKNLEKKVQERLHWLIPFSRDEIRVASAPLLSPRGGEGADAALSHFLRLASQGMLGGDPKKVTKENLSYLQPRGEKNVFIVESDQLRSVSWGSDFLAGSELAELLSESKRA